MLFVFALLVQLLLVVKILLLLLSLGSVGKVVGLILAELELGTAAVEATFGVSLQIVFKFVFSLDLKILLGLIPLFVSGVCSTHELILFKIVGPLCW